ncbi:MULTISPECIES: MFS transporter [unclassified Clostridium]|uniref:MFS transporter n=1 Tax=unclassified Clostridium TaxID=2614128 RepID=UPI0002973859|nr:MULTISPECIES: MFS transporter [unclassified Clostridium]EKQ54358.1 MAG: sugar phosphate permease [Clostridium sp. Maddingley MBC34-26]
MSSNEFEDVDSKRINSNVKYLSFATFLADIGGGLVNVVLPLFLTSLGLNKTFIGTVEGIADFTAGIVRIFSGWFSDKLRKRKIFVILGYLLAGISRPILAFVNSGFAIIFFRFSDRLGGGIRLAPADALIADESSKSSRGRAFGLNRAMDAFGAVVGPVLAYEILKAHPGNYKLIFSLTAIPMFLTVMVVTFLLKEKTDRVESRIMPPSMKGLNKDFKSFLLIVILFSLGNSSDAFLILRAQNLGIDPTVIPIWWAVFSLVATILSIPSGIISDRIGRKLLIIIGYVVFSIVYFGFAFAHDSSILWLMIGLYGIYKGLADGAQRTLVSDLVPSHQRGSAFGVFHTSVSMATLPSSIIAGLLWDKVGASAPFLLGGILALVSSLLMIMMTFSKEDINIWV